ncbi:MAG: hypothetical protein QG662_153 [Pseudomonadota bacterium]|nr:hypothetical protein [Pseudomonadota bacterium]
MLVNALAARDRLPGVRLPEQHPLWTMSSETLRRTGGQNRPRPRKHPFPDMQTWNPVSASADAGLNIGFKL